MKKCQKEGCTACPFIKEGKTVTINKRSWKIEKKYMLPHMQLCICNSLLTIVAMWLIGTPLKPQVNMLPCQVTALMT